MILEEVIVFWLSSIIVLYLQKHIISDKRYSERKLDVLSALVLAENAIAGPGKMAKAD